MKRSKRLFYKIAKRLVKKEKSELYSTRAHQVSVGYDNVDVTEDIEYLFEEISDNILATKICSKMHLLNEIFVDEIKALGVGHGTVLDFKLSADQKVFLENYLEDKIY